MSNSGFEVLDLSALRRRRRNESWIHQVFGDISRQSATKQVAIGGASGWVAGYLFVKVGKLAAISIGSTVLILQIAQHQGYIKIDWPKVNRGLNEAARKLEEEANRNIPYFRRNMKRFFQENVFLTVSFGAGFLIGMAF